MSRAEPLVKRGGSFLGGRMVLLLDSNRTGGGSEPPRGSHGTRGAAGVTYDGRGAADDQALPPTLAVPERLTATTRSDFRQTALAHIERLAGAASRVIVLDFRDTVEVDASGLGVLVHLRRRARDQGLELRLVNLSVEIRELLTVTRLAPLFDTPAE